MLNKSLFYNLKEPTDKNYNLARESNEKFHCLHVIYNESTIYIFFVFLSTIYSRMINDYTCYNLFNLATLQVYEAF